MEITQPGSGQNLTVTDGSTTVLKVKELYFTDATVTDGGGGIADIDTGAGIYATKALDNLASTNINADLNFEVGRGALIKVKDQTVLNTAGNSLTINGAIGNGSGNGGGVSLSAGYADLTGNGGNISISSGEGGATSGDGGILQITSGSGINGDSDGGEICIYTGNGHGTGSSGSLNIYVGQAGATGIGGDIGIEGGLGGATSGNAGSVSIQGGTATVGLGGNGELYGGDSANGSGGNVILQGGAGTVNNGLIYFTDPTSNISAIFDTSLLATADKTFTFPNKTGTFALTSDIPSLSGYMKTSWQNHVF